MAETREIPRKQAYKSSEVCQYTDTQPYVLQFWASEFPQLNPEKSRSGQPVYSRRDIELILRIKQLLHEEEVTIEEARHRLEAEGPATPAVPAGEKSPERRVQRSPQAQPPPRSDAVRVETGKLSFGTVPRDRYDDAVDEIAHLRLQLKDAETRLRRSDSAREKAEEAVGGQQARYRKALGTLERLLELLS